MKKKITFEFGLNCSPKVLYARLSTPGGLAEWFADDVNQEGEIFKFLWDGAEERAKLVQKKENKYVRFKWEADDDDDDSYFEFRLNTDELTGDVALVITDFVEEEDEGDASDLWETQIDALKHILGL